MGIFFTEGADKGPESAKVASGVVEDFKLSSSWWEKPTEPLASSRSAGFTSVRRRNLRASLAQVKTAAASWKVSGPGRSSDCRNRLIQVEILKLERCDAGVAVARQSGDQIDRVAPREESAISPVAEPSS